MVQYKNTLRKHFFKNEKNILLSPRFIHFEHNQNVELSCQ